MDFDEYNTAYLLYAPAKNPQGWNLDLADFGQALDDAFPEVRYRQEDGHPVRLSFWAMTAEGEEFDGFADNESRDTIALTSKFRDGLPAESADRFRVVGWGGAGREPECRLGVAPGSTAPGGGLLS
ncbi:hypothetical protein GTY44_32080 [Streptomyces sp. SID5914]|nr:hypothetical protein [Streptomyces sp. SID5914]MZG18067.1 hypothetical protein [Streptomyces sp. SID5914]